LFCGDRSPQFLQPAYSIKIPENLEVGHRRVFKKKYVLNFPHFSVIQLSAKSFSSIDGHPKEPISYSLFTDADLSTPSQYFRIDELTGVVTIRKQIDYDDPATPKLFQLLGKQIIWTISLDEFRCCTRRG
jgi:hypothetical protein